MGDKEKVYKWIARWDHDRYFKVMNHEVFKELQAESIKKKPSKEIMRVDVDSFEFVIQCKSKKAFDIMTAFVSVNLEKVKRFPIQFLQFKQYKNRETRLPVPWLGVKGANDASADNPFFISGKTFPSDKDELIPFYQKLNIIDSYCNDDIEESIETTGSEVKLFIRNPMSEGALIARANKKEYDYFWAVHDATGVEIKVELLTATEDDASEASSNMTVHGECHKCQIFLLMYSYASSDLKMLSSDAVNETELEYNQKLVGSNRTTAKLLSDPKYLATKVRAGTPRPDIGRGALLQGPAGTGKTVYIQDIPAYLGYTWVCAPKVASSLQGKFVGETEKKLFDLAKRACLLSWLPCALSLDEIDTLISNRAGGNTTSYERSALNSLLSIVGGADHVDNLYIFGATNLGSKVDKAFLRRMKNNNIYVGVLNAVGREALIQREIVGRGFVFASDEVRKLLVNLTMNLGGSHIKTILENVRRKLEAPASDHVTSALCLEESYAVCQAQRIRLGNDFLYDILKLNKRSIDRDTFASAPTRDQSRYLLPTGRILVYLGDNADDIRNDNPLSTPKPNHAYLEIERLDTFSLGSSYLNTNDRKLLETFDFRLGEYTSSSGGLVRKEKCLFENVVANCVEFCRVNNIDVLHVITYEWMLSESIDLDERTAQYLIWNLIEDSHDYKSYMILIDMDSAVPATMKSEDDNSDHWATVLHLLLELCRTNAKYSRSVDDKKVWVTFVTSKPEYLYAFRNRVNFPLTETELCYKYIEDEKETEFPCTKCDKLFKENDNQMGSCLWHSGGFCVVAMSSDVPAREVEGACRPNTSCKNFKALSSPPSTTSLPLDKVRWKCCGRDGYSRDCSVAYAKHEKTGRARKEELVGDIPAKKVLKPEDIRLKARNYHA
jgi:ATP-dependent 26S proteasome regulatory subunit